MNNSDFSPVKIPGNAKVVWTCMNILNLMVPDILPSRGVVLLSFLRSMFEISHFPTL